MHSSLRKFTFAVVLAAVAGLIVNAPASAQITMNEGGFTVTDLGGSTGAKGVHCSPGGIWGDYIYIADSAFNQIERVDFFDSAALFATMPFNAFPVGMDFGPGPGSNFGDYLYVACYGISEIDRVTPTGTVSAFASIPSPSDVAFDPSGAYGNDLFVATGYSGPISRVDEFGAATTFSTVPSLYIKFGPGGAWGSGMYSTSQSAVGIVKIDPSGVATNFCTGFINPEGFDWAYGTPFDGDMFATDVSDNKVWRVKSDGTRTLFADMMGAADATFCNGALYLVGFHGGCYKITPGGTVAVAFTDVVASVVDGGARIGWIVASDEEIDGFRVYRENMADEPSSPQAVSGLVGRSEREFTDDTTLPGESYRYSVAAVMPDGREIKSGPALVAMPRVAFSMSQNYPNPFNPATTIEYTLSERADVALAVYDAQGRRVVDLERGVRGAGTHHASWDGRDANGERVASGIYFYRLTSGTRTLTKKLVLVK